MLEATSEIVQTNMAKDQKDIEIGRLEKELEDQNKRSEERKQLDESIIQDVKLDNKQKCSRNQKYLATIAGLEAKEHT